MYKGKELIKRNERIKLSKEDRDSLLIFETRDDAIRYIAERMEGKKSRRHSLGLLEMDWSGTQVKTVDNVVDFFDDPERGLDAPDKIDGVKLPPEETIDENETRLDDGSEVSGPGFSGFSGFKERHRERFDSTYSEDIGIPTGQAQEERRPSESEKEGLSLKEHGRKMRKDPAYWMKWRVRNYMEERKETEGARIEEGPD